MFTKQHITATVHAILALILLCRQACCVKYCESNYDCDATDSYCHEISGNCVKCVTIPCDPLYMERNGHEQCIRYCPEYYKQSQEVPVPVTTLAVPMPPKPENVQEKSDTKVNVILLSVILCAVAMVIILIVIGIVLLRGKPSEKKLKGHNKARIRQQDVEDRIPMQDVEARIPVQDVNRALQESSALNEGQIDDLKNNR